MYQTGDRVVYGNNGICRVEKVDVPDFETFERGKPYYFLRCEADESRIYAPVDTHIPMRALMNQAEAQALLTDLSQLPVQLPSGRDHKTISLHYQKILQQHTPNAMACVIKSIYLRHRGSDGALGRMTSAEEGLLKKTEAQLCLELSAALGVSPEQARERLIAVIREK